MTNIVAYRAYLTVRVIDGLSHMIQVSVGIEVYGFSPIFPVTTSSIICLACVLSVLRIDISSSISCFACVSSQPSSFCIMASLLFVGA